MKLHENKCSGHRFTIPSALPLRAEPWSYELRVFFSFFVKKLQKELNGEPSQDKYFQLNFWSGGGHVSKNIYVFVRVSS